MQRTLEQWLEYQLRTHPQQIAMGLERVAEVHERLHLKRPARHVVTVAGTNGKGSTCAMLESIYRHAGLKVGLFTSPHLVSFRERIQVNRVPISETEVVTGMRQLTPLLTHFPADHHPLGRRRTGAEGPGRGQRPRTEGLQELTLVDESSFHVVRLLGGQGVGWRAK